jgi:drug/metabolite transporter (DMT)-like permease
MTPRDEAAGEPDDPAAAPELGGEAAAARHAVVGGRVARLRDGVPPGVRYMVAGAFFFSIMSLLVKAAGQRLPSQEVVLVRAAIMLALCVWALRRAGVDPWGVDGRLLVARGVIGFVGLSAFYYAVVHLSLAEATVIQYTNPIFAAVIAARVLGERIGAREGASLAAGLAGVLLVARPAFLFGGGVGPEPVAVAIGFTGAVFSGAAYVTVRKLGATEHPLVIIFYFALISTLGGVPTALPGWIWPTGAEWMLLLGVGVTTHLGQICITRGLKLEPAGRATAVGYLQIVFAAAWGALFFAEYPDAGTLLGAGLIVVGTLLLVLGRR